MNERGVALPMAMIALAILSALMVAFVALATTEPQIAGNHMAGAQARTLAESGVEQALQALSAGTIVLNANSTLPPCAGGSGTIPPAYAGGFTSVNAQGGFTVTVAGDAAGGCAPRRVLVSAVGYMGNNLSAGTYQTGFTAKRSINVTTSKFNTNVMNPPCAICAGGENPAGADTDLQVGRSASISASLATAGVAYCGGQPVPRAATMSQGSTSTHARAEIEAPTGGVESLANVPSAQMPVLSDTDIALLKAHAQRRGTYFQGNQTWTSEPVPVGQQPAIVFVDTPSGRPFTNSSAAADRITVDMHGTWTFNGWIVVAGSGDISGNVTINGLIYVQNDMTLDGSASGAINGAVISTNRRDSSATNIDLSEVGNAPVKFNCPLIEAVQPPTNWFPVPGSFQEVAG